MVYLTVLCMKEEARQVEDALRSAGFARPSQTWDDVPAYEKQGASGTDPGLPAEDPADGRTDRRSCAAAGTAENCSGLLPGTGRQICSAGRAASVAENFYHKRIYSPV